MSLLSELKTQTLRHYRTRLCSYNRHVTSVSCGLPTPYLRHQVANTVATVTPTASAVAGELFATSTALPITSLYTSQAYTHKRKLGPIQLEVIPGKGLGWRATRDIATGELLLASLPIAVLYGDPGEPPGNEELVEALRQSWPRLPPLERRWLVLLADCCAANCVPAAAAAAATRPKPTNAAATPAAAELPSMAATRDGANAGPGPLSSPPPPSPFHALEELLLRARALLAEGQQTDLAPKQHHQHRQPSDVAEPEEITDVGGLISPATTPRPATTTAGTQAAATTPQPSTAAGPAPIVGSSSFEILPAALFGAREVSLLLLPNSGSNKGNVEGVVADLVQRYSYSEVRDDLALSELLDVVAVSCSGLWPEMALFNHSCCPNASPLVAGGAVYVRAGRPVLEGEELTLSYLGQGVFKDVAERRSRLRASHGFLCTCPRCTMEHEHFPTCRYPELERLQHQHQQRVRQQLPQKQQNPDQHHQQSTSNSSSNSDIAALDDTVFAASLLGRRGGGPLQALLDAVFGAGRFRTSVAPDHKLLRRINFELVSELEAAAHATLTAASRPRQQQAALLTKLEGLLDQVEASCECLELPPRGRLMALASVYGLVRLTGDLAQLSQQVTPERRLQLLQLAADVLEAVAPGSDGHVTAAVKAAGMVRRVSGADSPTARRAELKAANAHLARYGRELLTEPETVRRLSATRQRLITGSGLAASMGVLAWQQQVGPG